VIISGVITIPGGSSVIWVVSIIPVVTSVISIISGVIVIIVRGVVPWIVVTAPAPTAVRITV